MIDAVEIVRRWSARRQTFESATRCLNWHDEWISWNGKGVITGLLDTTLNQRIPDLKNADLEVRDFTTCNQKSDADDHGTFSATLLVGQGCHRLRGLAPDARLLVATVVGADGVASPMAVVEAMEWLLSAGAQMIIIPLGEQVRRKKIAQVIEKAANRHVVVLAAAGNHHPRKLYFPARHPQAIAVGAANDNGDLLSECSRLPRLDLVAPGSAIPALLHDGTLSLRSGSSVACVLAAGVAMLALSAEKSRVTSGRLGLLATLTETNL